MIVVVGIAVLVWALAPLRRGPRTDAAERSLLVEETEERKRTALFAILDVEEEHEVGKLSAADLEILRAQYEAQAIDALRRLDDLGAATVDRDDTIEAEVARIRAEMTCPSCGELTRPGETCSTCASS